MDIEKANAGAPDDGEEEGGGEVEQEGEGFGGEDDWVGFWTLIEVVHVMSCNEWKFACQGRVAPEIFALPLCFCFLPYLLGIISSVGICHTP
jgi:hypothetical protein